ncbi:MAG: hypothetical protein JST84_02510 [Acidobacteria bacterium]|nr:hypothetical protein [Acidobacteriota bacterium]
MNRPLQKAIAFGIGCSLCLWAEQAALSSTAHDYIEPMWQTAKVLREFKGVKLGLKPEQVHAALGQPENNNDASEDYKLTGEDTMTVRYENGEVKAIQLAFMEAKNAPAWRDVVGDAEVVELANGAKTARKVLAEEKFWVAIYQNKEGTITRITISR